MPNWTYNTCNIISKNRDAVIALKNYIKASDDVQFDFNKVIPVPAELKDPLLHMYGGEKKEQQDLARKDAKAEWGYENAIDFCVQEWGTKWNACETSVSNVETHGEFHSMFIRFETAWSPPHPLLLKLSELFPDVLIQNDARDECDCYNPFVAEYKAGKLLSETEYEPSEEDEE